MVAPKSPHLPPSLPNSSPRPAAPAPGLLRPLVALALAASLLTACGGREAAEDGTNIGDSCSGGDDCSGDLRCVLIDPLVGDVCTQDCSAADATCPSGTICTPSASGTWCMPALGGLNNDGTLNNGGGTPSDVGGACSADRDCRQGLRCYEEPGGARFCVQVCSVASDACPAGQSCVSVDGDAGYCDEDADNNGPANNATDNNATSNNATSNNATSNNATDNNATGCTDDDACGAGRICLDGACADGCRDDDACPQGQICDTAALSCQPDPTFCEPDGFEPNDQPDSAVALSGGRAAATACAGDDDWYALEVDAGDTVTASLSFIHADGDLDLALFEDDGTTELASSATMTDGESLSLLVTRARTLLIRVSTALQEGGSDYTLNASADVEVDDPCADRYEVNDTSEEATPIEPGTYRGLGLCGSDQDDYYAIELGALDTITVDVSFQHADSDIDLALRNPEDSSSLDTSGSTGNSESVSNQVPRAGTYFIRVYNYGSGAVPYEMTITVTPGPEPPACDTDAFEPNDTPEDAVALDTTLEDAVACPDEVDLYTIEVTEADTIVEIDATWDDLFGTVDLELLGADGVTSLGSSAGDGGSTFVEATIAEPGTYYVAATLGEGDNTIYDLTLTQRVAPNCDDAWEPNDSFDEAVLIEPGTYTTMALCDNIDDDDYYLIAADAGTTIRATVRFRDSLSDIDVRLYDANRSQLDSSTSVTDDEEVSASITEANYYYLRVYTLSGEPNPYELTVEAEGFSTECLELDFEDNDTVEQAVNLAPGDHVGSICLGDPDTYTVNAVAGQQVKVSLEFSHAEADLELQLLDAEGTVWATADSDDDNELLPINVRADGPQIFRVAANGIAIATYDLAVELLDTPVEYRCFDRFEPNSATARAWPITPGDYTALDICEDFDEDDYFAIELSDGDRLTVDLAFTDADGDIDLEVLDTNGTSELADSTSATDDESVTVEVDADGTYYIHPYLWSSSSGEPAYEMSVRVE